MSITIYWIVLLTGLSTAISNLGGRPTVINREIKPIKEDYGSCRLMKRWQPFLDVTDGCVPFPAVDILGRINVGLNLGGNRNGNCSHNIGQVYSRVGQNNGNLAIMYTWWFPKDQRIAYWDVEFPYAAWENVVIWFTSTLPRKPYLVSYTARNRWKSDYKWAVQGEGDHLVIGKRFEELYTDVDGKGGQQPLIGWHVMPDKPRDALNGILDWGKKAWLQQLTLINNHYFYKTLREIWVSEEEILGPYPIGVHRVDPDHIIPPGCAYWEY